VAGIDIMKGLDDNFYCIEVNHCPWMNVQKFTPTNINREVVNLAINMAKEPVIESLSSEEVKELRKVLNHTFNNADFINLFEKLKGKVVETSQTGVQTIIRTKPDLQRLLVGQLVIR
jgi:hypothetical protein